MSLQVHNEIVLCLAHRPLPTDVLSKLVSDTGRVSVDILKQMESNFEKATIEVARSSPRNVVENDLETKVAKLNPSLHVFVTGSPYTTQDGRTFQDWERKWTKGEQILANVIETIGMKHFHSILRGGSVEMKAKLIGVKLNDFSMFDTPVQRLEKELSWIGENVLKHLNLIKSDRVGKVTVLYPIHDYDKAMTIDVETVINNVTQKEWRNKNCLFRDVELKILMVPTI